MQTSLETASGASYAVLLTLWWDNRPDLFLPEITKRYTNWTSELTVGADTFASVPNMEVELGEIHGGTSDKPGKLTISREFSPFDELRKALSHPRVNLRVEQCDPLDASNPRRQLFLGSLGRIRAIREVEPHS